jgi:two-component system sensor histidine kinase AlgZ
MVQSLLGHPAAPGTLLSGVALATLLAAVLLEYFRLRNRAFSPALAEARLQALQARIRPHFLFNSLNAVLSLMRGDPKRAEAALEDLADLFRSLLADNRKLIPMREEISLCRQYLNLEHLRLAERLQVQWTVDPRAEDALVPPMLLQPLVENAVYHGIEPGLGAGAIEIQIGLDGNIVRVGLANPYHPEHQHRQGNRMALANIRERLQLHFDVEGRLDTAVDGNRYRIDMVMPYRRAG